MRRIALMVIAGMLVIGLLSGFSTTLTAISPAPDKSGSSVAYSLARIYSVDELIKESECIVIGKVLKIMPSQEELDRPPNFGIMIYTDVIIEARRYLYGESQNKALAVRTYGGRIGDYGMDVEDEAVFTPGEQVFLFLNYRDFAGDLLPLPLGIEAGSYYRVTASQGKYQYQPPEKSFACSPQQNDFAIGYGQKVPVADIEKKIGEIYPSK